MPYIPAYRATYDRLQRNQRPRDQRSAYQCLHEGSITIGIQNTHTLSYPMYSLDRFYTIYTIQ